MLAGAARTPAHPQCSSPSVPKETPREIDWLAALEETETKFFCVGSFVFRSGFFRFSVSLRRPHCLAARPARPLVATF